MSEGVAIVTGAGRGIGRAVALELAARGYAVVLTGRGAEPLEQTAAALGPAAAAAVVPGDVRDPAHAAALVAASIDRFGRLDVVVNNAGHAPLKPVEQTTDDDWRDAIDTNLSAAFYLARAAWPAFRRRGGGAVVNISSQSARDPFDGFSAYGAAKAGLNLLGLALAREGKPLGVRVHTVAPGAVETPMLRSLVTPEQFPASQALAPADVARVVWQCVGGDLKHTSGEVIWLSKAV